MKWSTVGVYIGCLRKYIGFPGGILKDSDDLMAKVAQFSQGIGMYWNGALLSLHIITVYICMLFFKNIVMINMFCYDILCAGVAWVEWTMMNMLRYVEDFIAMTLSWKFDGIHPKNAIQHSQEKAYPARRTSMCFFSNWVDFLMDKCVEICGFLSCRVRKHALLVIYPIFGIPHKIGRYVRSYPILYPV